MTIEEWAKDFKSYVNWLDMPRDDYKGIMGYIDDAIAMLKEQEDRIGVLTRAIKQMPKPTKLLDVYGDGYAKIVRCKCCTHTEHCEIYGGFDGKNPDWFCADGERRDEDG